VPRWHIFPELVVPMARPGLIATALAALSFVWNEVLAALILTSSRRQTPIMISGQTSFRDTRRSSISAAALIPVLPMAAVTSNLVRLMGESLVLGGRR
jgi:multiple sugar transport system permease protein